jgi:taurine dioxygenase
MEVRRLAAALGAEVEGVDLRPPVAGDVLEAVHRALMEHQVLFFRGQDLSDDEHLELASQFGDVSVYPVARLAGATEPRVSYIRDSPDSPPDADGWHTDVTWIAEPPAAAFLSARLVPPVGGDTIWASLYAAYEALSPPLRGICEGLTVRHWYGDRFEAAVARSVPQAIIDGLRAGYPPVEHPLVMTHPVSGRPALLLAGDFMQGIAGMLPEESVMFLGFLQRLLDDPNIQVRWHWHAGDLAIWDERCTNHRALSDHYPQERAMRRCTVDGPLLRFEQDPVLSGGPTRRGRR